jgi:hypothetical protein
MVRGVVVEAGVCRGPGWAYQGKEGPRLPWYTMVSVVRPGGVARTGPGLTMVKRAPATMVYHGKRGKAPGRRAEGAVDLSGLPRGAARERAADDGTTPA